MMEEGDNKLRGRMSAYAFFLQTCLEEHRKEHPTESVVFPVFAERCADRWKTMTEEEKTRFHQMAEIDKMRYESEWANYKPNDKYVKRTKDPKAPKRPVPAFFWFSKDEYPKVKEAMPESTALSISQEITKCWNESSSEVRGKYEALAAEDKARYTKEVEAYIEANKKIKGTSSKSRKDSDEESSKEKKETEQEAAAKSEEKKDTVHF